MRKHWRYSLVVLVGLLILTASGCGLTQILGGRTPDGSSPPANSSSGAESQTPSQTTPSGNPLPADSTGQDGKPVLTEPTVKTQEPGGDKPQPQQPEESPVIASGPPKVGSVVPGFTLADRGGRNVSVPTAFSGRTVYIMFFSTT